MKTTTFSEILVTRAIVHHARDARKGGHGGLDDYDTAAPCETGGVHGMRDAGAAQRAGVPVLIAAAPSLSLDVDGPADLERLADSPLDRRSTAIARRLLGSRTA